MTDQAHHPVPAPRGVPEIPARVLVYGVGKSGQAAARLLLARGRTVVFYDDQASALPPGPWSAAQLHTGRLPDSVLSSVDLAVLSPGVHPDTPAFQAIERAGLPYISEIELASRMTSKPLVGVTGTNGKSTTVALVDAVLRAAGMKSLCVGNFGYPFSLAVLERPEVDWYVVEVSSYQLATIDRFCVRAGIVTNLAANHHQWHGTQENYFAAKLRLFNNVGPDGVAVYPAGCEYLRTHLASHAARKVSFSWGGEPGDVHYDAASETVVWRATGQVLAELGRLSGQLPFDYHAVLWNLLAAVAAGKGLGLPDSTYSQAVQVFQPLEHRMEPVGVVDGVRWVNDSKSTNVESTRYAIENSHSKLVLMLGGRDKGLDFAQLAEGRKDHIKAVVALGECRDKIRAQLEGMLRVHLAQSFEEAVGLARRLATSGDTVLFSPACASFDMFRDFEDRGRVFKKLVRQLAER
ncbi:MAG: UDP-N-acetylmuramoyl-L-alanine--D-glutamate ligase [Candidatus Wallbacteria bacterium]|nr:UDP-N-acetylmuramoyl-L-alanine--D-glutamate ligase [Candidatus Wallbacteria bacterium]